VVGDLSFRRRGRSTAIGIKALLGSAMSTRRRSEPSSVVLALDWSGETTELVIGRDARCHVALSDETVSRRHARLLFRDGRWIVHDLNSTNGTTVNGSYVGRCELYPGDQLGLGAELLAID
jgi:predicted component of type VI protein secretion system